MIFDWIFAIAVFGLIGSVIFIVLLQGIVSLTAMIGQNHQPTERRVSVRVRSYDYDEDN